MKPRVSVVVLNYNGRQHLGPCLESLKALRYPAAALEIVVCDNDSHDGSVEYVRDAHPDVRVIQLEQNFGFAEGNNRAVAVIDSELVAFLNNDMRVDPGWLDSLVDALESNPGTVCVSSKIVSWDGELIDFIGAGISFQGFGFQFDYGARQSAKDRPGRILCPCGGAMLIRRGVFVEAGGFDADYFSFYEDTDLGWRLNLFGHDVRYEPAAVAYHRHHGSFERVESYRKRVLYERNALFTMYKNLDSENLAVALPASLLLLNEKALSMSRLDTGAFVLGPAQAAPASVTEPPTAPEPPLKRVRRVLAEAGPRGAAERALRIPTRRWEQWRSLRRRQIGKTDFRMPLPALACYVGLSQFGRSLDHLGEKRASVQSRRRRSDEELLPLFHFALEPSHHDDPEYIDVHWQLIRSLGLDRRFGAGHLHGRA